MLKKNKVKFVAWGRTQGLKNYSWVDLDNEESVKLIMNFLNDYNHKNIAYINIVENYNFAFQRKQGYVKSLKKFNIKYNKNYYLSVSNEQPEQSASVIKKLLIQNPEMLCGAELSALPV